MYFFCNSNQISFVIDDKDTVFGCFNQNIIYPLYLWRKLNLPHWVMFLPMIEELCHAIWQIPDGPYLEEKATEVIKCLGNDETYQDYLNAIYEFIDENNL